MRYDNRNRNEFYTLLGAIYAFVAYLTAFTIEILFIIDLAKRGDAALGLDFLSKAKSQLALACFAIAILYFIIFLSSLVLIVALIMRSTMCIIIWLTIKIVLYLPEFSLIVYVSIYEWGVDTRNGQTEIIFYAIRAILDVIFIFKGHRLYKDWRFEKSQFFRFDTARFNGYDSPYFIGDSLTTTINPVFSSPHFPTSTLQAARYDHVRQLNSGLTNRLGNSASATTSGAREDDADTIDCDIGQRHYYNGVGGMGRSQSQQRINDYQCTFDDTLDHDVATKSQHLHHHHHYQPPHHQYDYHGHHHRSPAFISTAQDYYLEPDYDNRIQLTSKVPGMTYSTQSLDRRHLKDNTELALPEQVILRPLNHRPFDYLQRPGSMANLQAATTSTTNHQDQQVPGSRGANNNNHINATTSTPFVAGGSNQHQQEHQQSYLTRSHIERYNNDPFSYLSTANPLHPKYRNTNTNNYNPAPTTNSGNPNHNEAYHRR